MTTIFFILSTPIILWVFLSTVFYRADEYRYNTIKAGRLLRERTTTNYNFWALIFNIIDGRFSGEVNKNKLKKIFYKSDIDKQIAKEKKKIQAEEKQIESMEELERLIHSRKALEKKKESLFEDVHRDEQQDDQEEYHCYTCNKVLIGLDNFYKHRRKEHGQ